MEELMELLKSFNQQRDGEMCYLYTKSLPNEQGIVCVRTRIHSCICDLEFRCPAYLVAKILKNIYDNENE